MLLRAVYAVQPICIMDTLRLFISVLTIRVYLIIQVSLQVHAKAHFGSITKWFYTWLCSPQACNSNNNNNAGNLRKIDSNKINNHTVQYKILQHNKTQTYLITG